MGKNDDGCENDAKEKNEKECKKNLNNTRMGKLDIYVEFDGWKADFGDGKKILNDQMKQK